MLGSLLGSLNKERVLIFLAVREKGYPREIARFFDAPLDPVQKAMDRLEQAGVLIGRTSGSIREYRFNPRYPLRNELTAMLEKALSLYPVDLREALLMPRKRPRRKGKPL